MNNALSVCSYGMFFQPHSFNWHAFNIRFQSILPLSQSVEQSFILLGIYPIVVIQNKWVNHHSDFSLSSVNLTEDNLGRTISKSLDCFSCLSALYSFNFSKKKEESKVLFDQLFSLDALFIKICQEEWSKKISEGSSQRGDEDVSSNYFRSSNLGSKFMTTIVYFFFLLLSFCNSTSSPPSISFILETFSQYNPLNIYSLWMEQ